MLRVIRKRAPGLAKFDASLHSKHSELLVQGAAAGSPHIQSQTGVRQGDPAGCLYYCTLQDVLETLQELFTELRIFAYADVYLQGRGEQVTASYQELVELSSGIGLQVQPIKCAAYSTNSEAALAFAEGLCVRFVPSEECILAGMPVGSDAFEATCGGRCTAYDKQHRHPAGAAGQCTELVPATAQVIAAANSTPSTLCSMGTGRPSHAKSQGCNM